MSEKRRYDREYLDKFCQENEIKYENIDESIKITRDTRIKGVCKEEKCNEMFDKTFRQMVKKSGPYCDTCTKQNGNLKRKETKSTDEYKPKLEESLKKREKTCEEKYGNKYAVCSDSVKNKIKETLASNHGNGIINPSQIRKVQEKKKQNLINNERLRYSLTFLEKLLKDDSAVLYDEINELELIRESPIKFICKCGEPSNKSFILIKKYGAFCKLCQDINEKKKMIETNMKNRGVPYPFCDPTVIDKIKSTNFGKYGTEYPTQNEKIKQKTKNTCQKKLGVNYPQQSKIVREKSISTSIKKYAVKHPMQNAEIAEKASKSSYKLKDYTFPSGKVIKCQGYEPFALDILIKEHKIDEDDIITSRKEVPEIWYKDSDDKDHRYYGDTFIKSLNKFIEVKSTWTYKKNKEKVELTKNAVKEKGFLYECWVFDAKRNLIETIK